MRPTTRNWLDGLRAFANELRARRPVPDLSSPDATLAAERMILTAHLVTRLGRIDDMLAARRSRVAASATAGATALDPDPALVLTTSPVGIITAAELVGPSGSFTSLAPWLAFVTELEYRLWCIRSPDEAFARHVNLWNWVKTRVPRQRHAEFARHRLGDGEVYWLHRAGVAGAGSADGHECHLWKFNGRHASLLEPFVREGVAGRGAGAGTEEGP